MKNFSRALGVAMMVSGLAVGCGGDTTDPGDDVSPSLLELDNGGMTTANEAPSFGDTAFAGAVPSMGTTGTDTLLDAAGALTNDTVPAAMRHVYRVAIVWGHLPPPNDRGTAPATPAPAQSTDWSGSVSVANGVVSVRHTLLFDARDRIEARTRPDTVSFSSHTQPFVDGLTLTVRTAGPATSLHFATAAYTGDFPLPDSDGDVRRLGDGHNGVYYVAYEERPSCAQGFLFGHWLRARGDLGVFRGRVFDAVGDERGTVRGIWGRKRDGSGVFYGKHITNAGVFNGLLGGTYDAGHFTGVWGTASGARGALHGHYFDGTTRGDGHGVLLGRWREACGE